MTVQYEIVHTTVYRYRQPVTFGEHRVMFRPRDSHDLRVLATDLQVSPNSQVRMIQDPHSNSVALVQPDGPASELEIVCRFTIEHAHTNNAELPLAPSAEVFPFAYSVDERFDLEQYLRPHYDDPGGHLTAWARQFLRTDGLTGTRELLFKMNQFIRANFNYAARDEEGTQAPQETLKRSTGSCRDFALLMMEATRSLGFAARFVTGYVYVADRDGSITLGGGSTHAWCQVYLPGAGWVEFDPTNGIVGNRDLIRVGVARDPRQAVPLSGSYDGGSRDFDSMKVQVNVTTEQEFDTAKAR
jgi:transglutaminase-like putative cysteine protease